MKGWGEMIAEAPDPLSVEISQNKKQKRGSKYRDRAPGIRTENSQLDYSSVG